MQDRSDEIMAVFFIFVNVEDVYCKIWTNLSISRDSETQSNTSSFLTGSEAVSGLCLIDFILLVLGQTVPAFYHLVLYSLNMGKRDMYQHLSSKGGGRTSVKMLAVKGEGNMYQHFGSLVIKNKMLKLKV